MELTPLFSVLIANYNNGCYLQEAIDSVLAQEYGNWEIVIVDDKSTDNSIEIYDKYKDDNRFHVYFNEKNEGVGYTKNRCVEKANGWICGFLDPDDVLVGEEVFGIMVKTHMDNIGASMVYSNMYDYLRGRVAGVEVGPDNTPSSVRIRSSCSICRIPFHFVALRLMNWIRFRSATVE